MKTSGHDVDPDITNDPLTDVYHCVDGAFAPEEMECRRSTLRAKVTFVLDFRR